MPTLRAGQGQALVVLGRLGEVDAQVGVGVAVGQLPIFLAPYRLRPIQAASASGSWAPLAARVPDSFLNRAPEPSFGAARSKDATGKPSRQRATA